MQALATSGVARAQHSYQAKPTRHFGRLSTSWRRHTHTQRRAHGDPVGFTAWPILRITPGVKTLKLDL